MKKNSLPRRRRLARLRLASDRRRHRDDLSAVAAVPLDVLHAPRAFIGAVEGAAEATASLLKLVVGAASPIALQRRKPLTVLGYGISSLVRPLVGLATAPWHVLAMRVADRVGKGLRSSPRDALLADATPPEHARPRLRLPPGDGQRRRDHRAGARHRAARRSALHAAHDLLPRGDPRRAGDGGAGLRRARDAARAATAQAPARRRGRRSRATRSAGARAVLVARRAVRARQLVRRVPALARAAARRRRRAHPAPVDGCTTRSRRRCRPWAARSPIASAAAASSSAAGRSTRVIYLGFGLASQAWQSGRCSSSTASTTRSPRAREKALVADLAAPRRARPRLRLVQRRRRPGRAAGVARLRRARRSLRRARAVHGVGVAGGWRRARGWRWLVPVPPPAASPPGSLTSMLGSSSMRGITTTSMRRFCARAVGRVVVGERDRTPSSRPPRGGADRRPRACRKRTTVTARAVDRSQFDVIRRALDGPIVGVPGDEKVAIGDLLERLRDLSQRASARRA